MIEVPETAAAWRRWLAEEVVPWWAATTTSEGEGYVEYLTPDGAAERRRAKTPLVTARLVYAFSHAAVLGLGDAALPAAEHGFRFLTTRCWDQAEGGFFHELAADGAPLDRAKDLYDLRLRPPRLRLAPSRARRSGAARLGGAHRRFHG